MTYKVYIGISSSDIVAITIKDDKILKRVKSKWLLSCAQTTNKIIRQMISICKNTFLHRVQIFIVIGTGSIAGNNALCSTMSGILFAKPASDIYMINNLYGYMENENDVIVESIFGNKVCVFNADKKGSIDIYTIDEFIGMNLDNFVLSERSSIKIENFLIDKKYIVRDFNIDNIVNHKNPAFEKYKIDNALSLFANFGR